jgi:hypothetical protein
MSGSQAYHSQRRRKSSMAKVKKLIITCDRHGGQIDETTDFLQLVVTPGKKRQGRTRHEELELCESCAKAFLQFMEGDARE